MRRYINKRNDLVIMMISIVFFVTFLFPGILCTSVSYADVQLEVHNVLILNSYHQGFTWTKEENDGIMNQLQTSGQNFNIMTEYMDWKNNPTEEYIDHLYEYLKYKYNNKIIDIIITTDDKALEFALEYRKELFSDAPIVFSGVNLNGYKNLVKKFERVTGVIEVIDPTQTIEIALNINPEIKKVYLLYDNSESGLSTGELIIDKISELNTDLEIIPLNDWLYEDIIEQVGRLTEDSIVLLSTYYRDVANHVLDLEFVTREVSRESKVPVYHIYDFGLNKGTIGGALLSGKHQGEHTADLALRILQGEKIEDIPIDIPDTIRTIFDYNQLKRFQISLDAIPEDSEIINKPFSFYETYRGLVNGVLAAFIFLISFVCILLFYIRKIQKIKKKLADSHEELTQLYEELAASDEEMRQQYEEMLMINHKIREGEEKLTYLAYHDSLTGLPNKLSLYEDAKKILIEDRGLAALLFVDIDNFKYVNDTIGHAMGDQLIIEVSKRLEEFVSDDVMIYRLSGDEFIFLLDRLPSTDEASSFASNVMERFLQEFDIQNTKLYVSLSIGIVLYPDHGHELEELLKYADLAMYRVKQGGRNSYILYNPQMNQLFTERVIIEKHLHKALENNEFEVYYQPQYNVKSKQMTGFEALLRWRNPVLGNVSPLKFINIAEETRDIIPIGTWVLEQACAFLKELQEDGYKELNVSVNISMLQLLQMDFCEMVEDTLKQYQIKPCYLELEITETMLMESFECITPQLEKLSSMNIKIALDDFGKGYSSLNYLKQLPINTLKVDKSFIDPITDPDRDTLAGQIIMIGKSMEMCVVAEGVERQEQMQYLELHNCDKIQGYLFSKPVTKTEILKLLKSNMRPYS